MKPIDITLLAVTAGVGFMLFTMMRKAEAANNTLGPYERYLARPMEQNQNSYWKQYLSPGYLETQASKELAWAVANSAPSSENVSDSQGWTVG